MTALTNFCFDSFCLRPAGSKLDDLKLAETWVAWDTDHAGKVDPRFWLEQRPGTDSYLLLDNHGPLFFFKTVQLIAKIPGTRDCFEDVVELHIQFMPRVSDQDFARTRAGLTHGGAWLERVLKGNNIAEMFFDTHDQRLIAFAVKRLGFEQKGERLSKRLAPSPATV